MNAEVIYVVWKRINHRWTQMNTDKVLGCEAPILAFSVKNERNCLEINVNPCLKPICVHLCSSVVNFLDFKKQL